MQNAHAASAADPYEINVIIPLTGLGAFLGTNEATALSLVEKNVNAAGGVRGRQIHFAVQDDQSNPQVAVQLLNGIIAEARTDPARIDLWRRCAARCCRS